MTELNIHNFDIDVNLNAQNVPKIFIDVDKNCSLSISVNSPICIFNKNLKINHTVDMSSLNFNADEIILNYDDKEISL